MKSRQSFASFLPPPACYIMADAEPALPSLPTPAAPAPEPTPLVAPTPEPAVVALAPRVEQVVNYCLRAQYTIPTNNLCPETCRVMFTKMTPKSKFLLAHLKMAQLV